MLSSLKISDISPMDISILVKEMRKVYCKMCGVELNDGSAFCHKCGHKITKNNDINNTISDSSENLGRIDATEAVQYVTIEKSRVESNSHKSGIGENIENIVGTNVKRTGMVWKRTSIIVSVLAVIVLATTLYVKYFVSGPEATLERMVEALEETDINTAIECFCPKVVGEYKGMLSVGDTIMGVFGLSTDMEALAGLIPAITGTEISMPDYSMEVVSIEYSGGTYDAFPYEIEGIGKLLASDALVTVNEYEDGTFTYQETFHLKNYGSAGWLIEDDIFANW